MEMLDNPQRILDLVPNSQLIVVPVSRVDSGHVIANRVKTARQDMEFLCLTGDVPLYELEWYLLLGGYEPLFAFEGSVSHMVGQRK